MPDEDNKTDGILVRLRQEFIETTSDQLEEIERNLDRLSGGQSDVNEELLCIQRNIHNIKGQGATFGFPLTGRVAHMLEDYLKNVDDIRATNIADIGAYIGLMVDLIETGESVAQDDPQSLFSTLPTGRLATFSAQQEYDVNMLLVMLPGLQRKLVAKKLLSCGFRVMRAYDSIEALSAAVDITPQIVIIDYDMVPFDGRELCNMFFTVKKLSNINIILLTSYKENDEHLQNLPDNVCVIEKQKDFTESLGKLLLQWGVFGKDRSGSP